VDIGGYLAVIRRWWWTLVVATWVAALTGLVVASRIPPTYQADSRLLVGPLNTDLNTIRAAGQLVQTYAELSTTPSVLEAAAQELRLTMPLADLQEAVTSSPNDVLRILTIRVRDGDAAQAARIANGVADELIRRTSGSGVTQPEGQLTVIQFARADTTPVAPQVSLIVMLAALTGLLGAIVAVLLVEFLSGTIRSTEDLTAITGAPVLAVVGNPRLRGPAASMLLEPTANLGRYRFLATKLLVNDEPTRRLLVVGLEDHDTSARVAANLAAAAAADGVRVALIDGSPASADLSKGLGVQGEKGVADLTPEAVKPWLQPFAIGGATVLPAGTSSNAPVNQANARALLASLGKNHEFVVVHAPPAHRSSDALVWAGAVDGILIVTRRQGPRREDLVATVDSLRAVGGRIVGTTIDEGPVRREWAAPPVDQVERQPLPALRIDVDAGRPPRTERV
jgi:capsular polysaccharide biosynthesis protein